MRRSLHSNPLALTAMLGLAGCCSAAPPTPPAQQAPPQQGAYDVPADSQVLRLAGKDTASPPAPHHWKRMPGLAHDIAAGADGSLWVIGVDARPGGYGIYRWSNHRWQQVPGAAIRITLDPQGQPWVVNEQHGIYRLTGDGHWQQLPGAARDISIGADGSVWVIGTDRQPGGFGVYRWRESNSSWKRHAGAGGARIAVGPSGEPWVIDNRHRITRKRNGSWQTLAGSASDIAVSADGQAWITGRDPLPNGYGIYRWSPDGWTQVSGAAVSIAVGPIDPWVVGAGHDIYRTL